MRALRVLALGLSGAATLTLDALTKAWAERALAVGVPLPVLGDVLRLTLGYNTGVAFGLFAGAGAVVLVLTGGAIAALALWLLRSRAGGFLTAGASGLVVGGGAANFIDRWSDGRVTDVLDAGIGAVRWPSFNLADAAVVIGVGLLMLTTLRERAAGDAMADRQASPVRDI